MNRQEYRDNASYVKPLRHSRVPFHIMHCEDCGRGLRATHVVHRFGGRCRSCWSIFHGASMPEFVEVN